MLRTLDQNLGLMVVGYVEGPTVAGIYRISLSISLFFCFGLFVLNMPLAKPIVTLYESGDKKKLRKLLEKANQMSVIIAITIISIYSVFGGYLVDILFGEAYEAVYALTLVLGLGALGQAYFGTAILFLNMVDQSDKMIYPLIIGLFSGTILYICLIPWTGVFGAAIGQSFSLLISSLLISRATKSIIEQ